MSLRKLTELLWNENEHVHFQLTVQTKFCYTYLHASVVRKTTTRGCFETCPADDILQTTNKTNGECPLASSCITPFGRTATREMITTCWYHHSPLAKRQLGGLIPSAERQLGIMMMVENGSATHIQPLAEPHLGMELVYANQLGNSHDTTTNISKNDHIYILYIKCIYTHIVKHCHQQNGT